MELLIKRIDGLQTLDDHLKDVCWCFIKELCWHLLVVDDRHAKQEQYGTSNNGYRLWDSASSKSVFILNVVIQLYADLSSE